MYELKYKITEADVKAVNKSIMWAYFIPYLIAALVGIAVGITATVLRPRTEMLVLGIVLIVLGAILLGCAILLLIAPKNFVVSALIPSDETERVVKLSDDNITVSTEGKADIVIDYYELNKLKSKQNRIIAYIGKEQILIIKNAEDTGYATEELFGFIKGRITKLLPALEENVKAAAAEKPTEPASAENENETPADDTVKEAEPETPAENKEEE